MNFISFDRFRKNSAVHLILLLIISISSACNTSQLANTSSNPYDPFEETNRKIHAFNKHVDETTLKPAANIYGQAIPRPLRLGTANFYENLQEPRRFVNHLGQAEFIKATSDVTRFAINTSIGIFGIFDVASRLSLFSDDTDFDETFAYWGLPIGPYMELPFVGPSSVRGSLSMLANYTLNPMSLLSGPAEGASLITFGALDILNKRYEYGTMFDTILYNSLDSYYSARSTYLQTRINEPPEPMVDDLELFDPYSDY
ncbi:MAG: hypothetical protein CML39_01070 [Rhodobacteraceae bacterium]|nr:MAG: hypothetical protein CML39_01070 [Paracoccaceae bacterium]